MYYLCNSESTGGGLKPPLFRIPRPGAGQNYMPFGKKQVPCSFFYMPSADNYMPCNFIGQALCAFWEARKS